MDLESSSLFIYGLFNEADSNLGWRWRMGWLMNDILQRKRNKTFTDNLLCTNIIIHYSGSYLQGLKKTI
jgi:hypothetical protein